MRIFVTGAMGYVGSHVATALARGGHEVAGLVRDDRDRGEAAGLGYEAVPGDLEGTETLTRAIQSSDAVVHCAASDDPAFLPINRRAVDAMLGALRPDQPFAMHGGSMVFGDTGPEPRSADAPFAPPLPLVGRAELDRRVLDHGRDRGTRTFIVYGALVHGGAGAIIPRALVRAARQTGSAAYVGEGTQIWSSVHVEDWAELIARAVEDGQAGGHAFVAAGPPVTMLEAAAATARACGLSSAIRSVTPDEASDLWGIFGPALSMSQHYSPEKAERLLGWRARKRDLAASLTEVAAGRE